MRNRVIHQFLIVVIGLIVYSNALSVPFVLDDDVNIVQNPLVKGFNYFLDPSAINATNADDSVKDFFRTRLIGYLSFAINYSLNGYDVTGYHIFNIMIHIINALLVFWFMTLLLRSPYLSSIEGQGVPEVVALTSALLFVCHPIQTQAVTYIVQRFASLATLFYLLSVVTYVWSRLVLSNATKRYALYAVSIIAAICAMRTKEISFTLPVMIVAVDFLFFTGDVKKRLIYLVPILLTILVIPLTILTAGNSFNLATSEGISRWDYLLTQFRVIVTYIRLLCLPVAQNLDYDYPVYRSLSEPAVALSLLFLLAIIGLAVYLYYISFKEERGKRHRTGRLVAFGIAWFFVTISVESSIVPIEDVIFEHRVYLPGIGFFIVLGAVTGMFWIHRAGVNDHLQWRGRRMVLLSVIACVVLVLSVAAYHRNGVWRDNLTLWKDAVEKSPKKARPHNNLGMYYERQGDMHEAIEHYKTATVLKPDYVVAHMNLGRVYAMQGLTTEYLNEVQMALKSYDEILKDPRAAKRHKVDAVDVAGMHYAIGGKLARQGIYDKAAAELQAAIRLNPNLVEAYVDMGNIYAITGNIAEAINQYQMALQINPNAAEARNNLDIVRRQQTR
ncbi:MAG: tetratricopeptide repeat protein [Nitrospirae bacterium]|nr:tetratricopeptide repeat protein [Nitrospirota bacterium]MBF0590784.1 tetratricopeptide repeat protein [Nitrospirota bacterium]